MELRCPHCCVPLAVRHGDDGQRWICAGCGGQCLTLAVLRKSLDGGFLTHLWAEAERAGLGALPCPACSRATTAVSAVGTLGPVALDVCRPCQTVWFDRGELGSCPLRAPELLSTGMPLAARKALAVAEVKALADRTEREEGQDAPREWWKVLATLIGLPVKENAPELSARPWVTWSLVLAMTAVTFLTLPALDGIVRGWGFVPAHPWRHAGTTLVTAFFLHGGLLHLAGNAYFLLVFGDNVEDRLGRPRFIALIASAPALGDLLHALAAPDGDIPCVGASGGISGVLAFYALAYPRVRLCLAFGWLWWFRWIRIPSWAAFGLWLALQSFTAWQQAHGIGNVSAFAHLGGVLAGIGWWAWDGWRRRTVPAPAAS